MKQTFFAFSTLFMLLSLSALGQVSSPAYGEQPTLLPAEKAQPAQGSEQLKNQQAPEVSAEPATEAGEFVEKLDLKEKRKAKLKKKLNKKLEKDKFRKKWNEAFDEFNSKANPTFEDFVTLAGAIVTVLGILSIIFDPITGVVVAVLGLLVYLLGRNAGGSINNIF